MFCLSVFSRRYLNEQWANELLHNRVDIDQVKEGILIKS